MQELKNLSEILCYYYSFYEKKLDGYTTELWLYELRNYSLAQIKKAFLDYVGAREGKFLPRPSHILEILKQNMEREAQAVQKQGKRKFSSCYSEACALAWQALANADKEKQKQAKEGLQRLQVKIAREYLLFLNGSSYQLKASSTIYH